MKIGDIEELLKSLLHQTCLAIAEAKLLRKSGVKVTDEDMHNVGMQIAKKALKDSRKKQFAVKRD